MKVKLFSTVAVIGLLLAGCNNSQPAPQSQQTQQTQVVTQIVTQEPTQQMQPLPKDFKITSPDLSQPITSPVTIKGKMTRQFFFEGSFPVMLQDGNGKVIANGPAVGDKNWAGEDMPTFSVTLTFAAPVTDTGTLVLAKDNPSGMPQNDDSRKVKVFFKKPLAGPCDPNVNWTNYKNDPNKVEFCYPKDFTVKANPGIFNSLIALDYPGSYFQGTNLDTATVDLSAGQDPNCMVSMYDQKALTKKVVQNGVTFYEDSWGEGAAGHLGENLSYNTVQNGVCYRFGLSTSYANMDNYKDGNGQLMPGAPKEFDKAGVIKLFGDIFATLKVK